jgi:hypothetical protein
LVTTGEEQVDRISLFDFDEILTNLSLFSGWEVLENLIDGRGDSESVDRFQISIFRFLKGGYEREGERKG